jgi:pyridoxamine 5'-phosphate oxidase
MTADPTFRAALAEFQKHFDQAHMIGLREPAAAALATVNSEGQPAVRVVLVRDFDEQGFVFYTNSLSRKGRELAANPRAALCFYWDALAEQVRIEGIVEFVSPQESDLYWASRSRDRQIGAWVSNQSERLDSPSQLMQKYAEFEQEFEGRDVPRPEHWYGYRLVPRRIEFWSNRPARLHERIVYERPGETWMTYYLYP